MSEFADAMTIGACAVFILFGMAATASLGAGFIAHVSRYRHRRKPGNRWHNEARGESWRRTR